MVPPVPVPGPVPVSHPWSKQLIIPGVLKMFSNGKEFLTTTSTILLNYDSVAAAVAKKIFHRVSVL